MIAIAKKRKTLPKDFQELINNGDVEKLKNVFDLCDINAYERYSKQTALFYENIPDEFIKWLVEQGADINAHDRSNDTPVMIQIRRSQSPLYHANIDLYLDLGADTNGALYGATYYCAPKIVKKLIDRGADVNSTALEDALEFCSNAEIVQMAEIVDYYLEAGVKVTDKMKVYVESIGENFEPYRDSFNEQYLERIDNALTYLYKCFNAVPVAKLNKHDGVSRITVKGNRWQDQFNELWDYLVPGSGCTKTVQGEVIRIMGRVSHELIDNGGANWDKDYKNMLQSISKYIDNGILLSESEVNEINLLIKHINECSDEMIYRLSELGVKWVVLNPDPILMIKPDYSR